MKKKLLSLCLALLMLLTMLPVTALAAGPGSHGEAYDHVDVKIASRYTINVNGTDQTLEGRMDPKTIKVEIRRQGASSLIFDFSTYNVTERTETDGPEYHIDLQEAFPANAIEWDGTSFKMKNVYVSGRILLSNVPQALKDLLPKTQDGTNYIDLTDYYYTGVQECTGGNGMRSKGRTGTPSGLDLYITADGLELVLTKGRLAIQKTVVNESGEALPDSTAFSYTLTKDGAPVYFLNNAYVGAETAGASSTVTVRGGETVTLTDLPAGTYTITEQQQPGYIIRSIDGESSTTNYSKDYVIKAKNDESIPVAVFTNTKLTELGGISLAKVSEGLAAYDLPSPNPTVAIYAAENGEKTGNALWTGTLTANGDRIYLNSLLPGGTYLLEETNADMDGFIRTTTLNGSGSLLFTVTAGETVMLTLRNVYEEEPQLPEATLLTLRKVDGVTGDELAGAEFTVYADSALTKSIATLTTDENGELTYPLTEAGTLSLKETKAPAGYLPSGNVYTLDVTLNKELNYYELDVQLGGRSIELPDGILFVENTPAVELVLHKEWVNDTADVRPDAVTIEVRNGEAVAAEVTLTAAGQWTGRATLPKYDENGGEIAYTLREKNVPAHYTPAYDGLTVTNTYDPPAPPPEIKTVEKTVVKVWADGDDQDGLRPDAVTVQLYAGGKATGNSVKLTADGKWTYTWKDLPETTENGTAIVYTVQETDTPKGYTASYSADGFTITNTHETSKVYVTVEKKWVDCDSKTRPTEITVQLYADGKALGDPVKVTKDGKWNYTWKALPAYAAGKEIVYTTKEVKVPDGYNATYSKDGLTITNTLKSTPKTGDSANLWLYGGLMLVCLAALAVLLLTKKKHGRS